MINTTSLSMRLYTIFALLTPLFLTGCLGNLVPSFDPQSEVQGDDIRLAIQEEESNPHAYYMLGREAFEEEHYQEAIKYFKKAIAYQQDYEEAYYGFVLSLLKQEKWKAARQELAVMTGQFGESARTCTLQAQAEYELGELARSEAFANKAVQLNSNEANALIILGRIAYSRADYQEALSLWGRAIEAKPSVRSEIDPLYTDLKKYVARYSK